MDVGPPPVGPTRAACVDQAGTAYGVAPADVWREIKLRNGRTGEVRRLPDGTFEIGLLRIPSSALPALQRYGVSGDNLMREECLNIQVGTYMLRLRQLEEASAARQPVALVPPAPPMGWSGQLPGAQRGRQACMVRAASAYQLPLELIKAIAKTEGGDTGTVRRNRNGTVDMGVMQVNSVHLTSPPHRLLARGVTREQLIFDDCVNIAVAASILRFEIDQASEFWTGVSRYHSRNQRYGLPYLVKVVGHLRQMVAGVAQ